MKIINFFHSLSGFGNYGLPPNRKRHPRELERVKQYVETHGEALDHPSQTADSSFILSIERGLVMILARKALGAE